MSIPFQLALGNNTPTTVTSAFGRIQLPDPTWLDVGGGAATQVLTTDGASNLYWAAVTATGTDAPSDGNTWGRVSGSWARVVKLTGDVMTGLLTLSAAPTLPLHAATKAYVDLRLLDAPVDSVTYARNNAAWIPVTLASLGGAPLANPVFTGDPRAPTPLTADNDTSIATTGYVQAQGYATSAAMTAADALKAPLASPVFTGDPRAPTPATADNDTSIATTGYVQAQGYATSASVSTGDALRVLKAGDAMTGALTITTTTVPPLNATGEIRASGATASLSFYDQDASGDYTALYRNGNFTQLFDSAAGRSVLSVASTGNATFSGSITVSGNPNPALAVSGDYTVLWSPDGTAGVSGILLGNAVGGGSGILYRNARHLMQARDGLTDFAVFENLKATFNGNIIHGPGSGSFRGISGYTVITGPDGVNAIFVGDTAAATNFYRSTQHIIQDPSGTLWTAMILASDGVQVGGPVGGRKGAGTLNAVNVYASGNLLSSDASFKTDIEPLTVRCLPLVAAVEPKSFRWREPLPLDIQAGPEGGSSKLISVPEGWTERRHSGFLAQDLADTEVPGIVEGKPGDMAVDIGAMLAVLWQATRELAVEVAALKGS